MINNLELKKQLLDIIKQYDDPHTALPEDEHPDLSKLSMEDSLRYFTLPMALDYRRDSYKLWQSAKATFLDPATNFVFKPEEVINLSVNDVQEALTKYKLAIQYNKQTEIWIKLCETLHNNYNDKVSELLATNNYSVMLLKKEMQKTNKKSYPYISGDKLFNYWLMVLKKYLDIPLQDIEKLSLAIDSHIVKASYKLQVITEEELNKYNSAKLSMRAWDKVLQETSIRAIDLQNPLWLWAKNELNE
ncbi:hypothetical protein J2Z60_001231 [Lactobacillus colini]|uniref:Uncharacterized protein n=1 Tax=Lactobacillus colini TaxID=1819254 RepID=A0ABS4MFA6_9LACO|nr:hypothetical protein [Lactobacillus colini]MBP2058054.1 hypothetical protein [Lactobacillus colini]